MKLLFYSPQSLPSIGGLQYVVHYWAEEMARRGHEVTLITYTDDRLTLGINAVSSWQHTLRGEVGTLSHTKPNRGTQLPNEKPPANYMVLRRASLFQQWQAMRRADKILMFNVSLKALPLVLLSGKPLYVTHHTALWYDNGPRPLRQRIKHWVANNRLVKDNCACSAYIAGIYKNCRVIHSPYRSSVFGPGTLQRIPGSILFVGRLVSDKAADVLLRAFHRLKYEIENLRLTIAGSGPDRKMLMDMATAMGLEVVNSASENPAYKVVDGNTNKGGTVAFVGALPQQDLIRLMQTHEIMVVPSRMEPMGMVVAEGMACGCRMVVSNQGGLPEVGGAFCRYFKSGDAVSLAKVLQEEISGPLVIDAIKLQAHLQKFTIGYSVDRLETWLLGL